jgi:proline dehydrogenase
MSLRFIGSVDYPEKYKVDQKYKKKSNLMFNLLRIIKNDSPKEIEIKTRKRNRRGISKKTVIKWRNGDTKFASGRAIEVVCRSYGYRIEFVKE